MTDAGVRSSDRDVHGALRLARDLTRVFGETPDLDTAFRETLARICTWADWPLGQVWLADPDDGTLRPHSSWYEGGSGLKGFRAASQGLVFAPGEGLPGRSLETRRAAWIDDVRIHPNFNRARAAAEAGLITGMAAPVFAGSRVVAVLEFFTREQRSEDIDMLDLVSTVAAQLGSLVLRRQAEEALRHSEARFQAVTATAADAIVLASSDGLIAYMNPGAKRMFGRVAGEAIGRPLTILMPERFHESHRRGIERFLETRVPSVIGTTVEVVGLRADGEEFPMDLSLATWSEGDQVYFSGIIRDITERRKTDDAKTMFLATASHELRTPLTVIQGFSEILRDSAVSDEQRAQAVEAIARRSSDLNDIVDRILLTSRIESGKLDLAALPVDVAEVVRRHATDMGPARAREIRVTVDADVPRARTDPSGLATVVDHLLDNAMKYSPEGGAVDVDVSAADGHVAVRVADQGVGMTAEETEHCFDRFWQAEAGDTRAFGGTGIGLFIVRSIVEAMGGRIGVESSPGAGSAFTFHLPISSD